MDDSFVVRINDAQYATLRSVQMLDSERLLLGARLDGGDVVLLPTPSELEVLTGSIAAEANHTKVRRRQRELDEVYQLMSDAMDVVEERQAQRTIRSSPANDPLDKLLGRWTKVSSSYFLPKFLKVRGEPFVELAAESPGRVSGPFRIAAVEGFLDGRPDGRGGLILSFMGKAAGDPVHGAATAVIVDGVLELRLMPFRGDFWDVRAATRAPRD